MSKEGAYFNQNQQTNVDLLFTKAIEKIKPEPTGASPLTQLQLQYEEDNIYDRNELIGILTKLLTYPSTQLAQIHRKANRLGSLYLKENQNEDPTDYQRRISSQNICACCGLLEQSNTLIISTGLKNIRHIGVSTYLYFMTIKSVISLVLAMILIYSIFAIITNITASTSYKNSVADSVILVSQKSYQGILLISLGSKQLHETDLDKSFYTIQCWLGVAMIVVWGILFGIIKYLQRLITTQIDNELRSAADFTIFIKNFPTSMTKQQLTKELHKYCTNLGFSEEVKVQKINKASPYYLQRSQFNNENLTKINEECKDYEQIFIGWVKERQQNKQFSTPQAQRSRIMREFHQLKKKKDQEYMRIEQNIKYRMRQKIQTQTVPAFITLSNSFASQFLVLAHSNSHSLYNRLFYKHNEQKFYEFSETNQIAKIKKAPQPEDIIWANQGQNFATYFKKRVITYGITLLLLGCSFAAIYGLSSVQYKEKEQHQSSSQYISVLISICISIITIIINLILRVLTNFQRISTFSHYQIGLAIKGVVASLINSILIPILVNYFFKQNLYGTNGLAEDVFYLGITNSFVTPLVTIFNPQYLLNWVVRKYKSRPASKLYQNQNQLNAIYENLEFQVGYQYIYVVNLFLFTCFFVSLQPIIAIFAIVGLAFTYWAKKYSLFARSQKPIPGNNSVNTVIYQLIYLGPAFYTIGSFCWSNFFKKQFIGIAPNLVAAILSGIIFLIPFKTLTKKMCSYEEQKKRVYLQDRIYLPSEYDRLNPLTSQESIQQYKKFISHAVLDPKNNKQLLHLQNQLVKMRGLGNRNYRAPVLDQLFNVFDFGHNSYNSNQIMLQKIYDHKGSTFNPLLLLNMTMPNNENAFRMGVQNWFNNEDNASKRKISQPGQILNIGKVLGQKMISDQDQVLKVNNDGLLFASKILAENKKGDTHRPAIKYTQERDIGDQNMNEMNKITDGNIPMNLTMNMFGNLFTNNAKRKSVNPNNQLSEEQALYLNFHKPQNNRPSPYPNLIPIPKSEQKLISHQNYTSREYQNPFDQIMNHNGENPYSQNIQPQMNPYGQMFANNYYPNSNYYLNNQNQRNYRKG